MQGKRFSKFFWYSVLILWINFNQKTDIFFSPFKIYIVVENQKHKSLVFVMQKCVRRPLLFTWYKSKIWLAWKTFRSHEPHWIETKVVIFKLVSIRFGCIPISARDHLNLIDKYYTIGNDAFHGSLSEVEFFLDFER